MSAMRTCKCGCGRQFERLPHQRNRQYFSLKCEAKARAQRARESRAGVLQPLAEEVRNEIDMAPIREQEEVLEALCAEAAQRTDMGRGVALTLRCLGVEA